MEDNDNPYDILGVPEEATQQQIKAAYRKLALKLHPDKQSTEEARKESTVLFAKISNAYEILGDEVQRQNYDREAAQLRDTNVNSSRPWHKMPRRSSGHHADHFFHHTQFHDPFSVFESVFREEFGADFFGRRPSNGRSMNNNNARRGSVFDDPFFGGGMPGGSMFGNDPFFGGGMPGGSMFGNDPFFGGGGGGPFGGGIFGAVNQQMNGMMNMHQNMMQQHQQQHQSLPRGNNNGNGRSQTFVYSSSTMGGGGANGESVTKSTTTRIINGKRQVVTERIVHKADGTVERHVERSGDEDFPQQQQPRLSHDDSRQRRRALEQAPSAQQQQQHHETRPPSSKSKSSSQRRDSKPKGPHLFKRKRRDSSKAKRGDE